MVSGVELTHPDKGTEMFLYELGVAERFRGRGIGRRPAPAHAHLDVRPGLNAPNGVRPLPVRTRQTGSDPFWRVAARGRRG